MEWSELNPVYVIKYGMSYPIHRRLCYLSSKLNKNLVPHPLSININVTERCNLRCKMCHWWKNKFDRDELTDEELLNFVNDIHKWGVKRLNFGGGEPLLRKNTVFKLLHKCNEYGIDTGLVTNGWMVNQDTADKLISSKLGRVSISVDGLGETHDRIRGVKGSFDKVMNAIDNLNATREKFNNKCVIHINTVLCNENLDEILDLVQLAKNKKCIIWIQALHSYDDEGNPVKNLNDPLWIPNSRLDKLDLVIDTLIDIKKKESGVIGNPTLELKMMKEYFRNPVIKRNYCYAGFDAININSFGDIRPCWHWIAVGNIKEAKIWDIWKSETYTKNLMKMQKCKYPCLLNCHYTPGSLGSIIHDLIYLPVMRKIKP